MPVTPDAFVGEEPITGDADDPCDASGAMMVDEMKPKPADGGLSREGVPTGEVGLEWAEIPRTPETERRSLRCCRSSRCLWNSSSSSDADDVSSDGPVDCGRREEAEDELR